MKFALGFLTLVVLLVAYSTAKKHFWDPLELFKDGDDDRGNGYDYVKTLTPTPTPTPTSTSTSTSTSALNPCFNGCVTTIGTSNGPISIPPYNTNYNGNNPSIVSYPTDQP